MKHLRTSILACLLLSGCFDDTQAPDMTAAEHAPAGKATVTRLHNRSYVYPAGNLDKHQQLDFWTGFSLFRDPWVIAPSSTKDRDGLGPLFNTRSCISCHQGGGRAVMSEPGMHLPNALVLRLGTTELGKNAVDPVYGGQIQPRTISQNVPAEAWLELEYETIEGHYADGQSYTLQKPHIRLTQLGYGELAEHIAPSPRYAPNVYGMGLLDAIKTQDLLAQEDVADEDNDGISAKYNRVPNVQNGQFEVGRFGLKAKQPNLKQQVAAAFRDDIGITNSLFPQESCTDEQRGCVEQANQGPVEIPDKLLRLVVEFNRFIGVPPARDLDSYTAEQGRLWFYQVGCHSCHTPNYTTDENYPVTAFAGQRIWPYTDLALHDMGPELADGVNEFDASGNEWRTPPLWGIGLQQRIVPGSRFLHDGRAATIEEAILWHGGEGEQAKQQFIRLSAPQRRQLIEFIKAI